MLAELPREVEGFDAVEWLVVDDGSTDRTAEVARAGGADHLVRLTNNKGLAAAFQAGLDAALKLGADVIVNTDADNQYLADDIPKLVAPILDGRADMVVGDRQVDRIEHFSATKKVLQRLGSWVVRRASGTDVPDTTSGFRAYNREAALQLVVVSNFTYTLESLIQAGKMLVAVEHVPIRTNPQTRESRLFDSTGAYVRRNALAIFRAYVLYEPLRVFTIAACGLLDRGARRLDAVRARCGHQRRLQRPRAVADPRRRAGGDRGADVRPRDHRRHARGPAGDRPAGLRARAAAGAGGRGRALSPRAGPPSPSARARTRRAGGPRAG